jgi:hypothetical protein
MYYYTQRDRLSTAILRKGPSSLFSLQQNATALEWRKSTLSDITHSIRNQQDEETLLSLGALLTSRWTFQDAHIAKQDGNDYYYYYNTNQRTIISYRPHTSVWPTHQTTSIYPLFLAKDASTLRVEEKDDINMTDYNMSSTLKKRKKKMNKHKYQKLRKRTRALRKRLGK